jgi:hypothetical protein
VGFWLNMSESLPFVGAYMLLCLLFLLFFCIGSGKTKAHTNFLLNTAVHVSAGCRRRALCLFLVGQLYYLYIILSILTRFTSVGFSIFENLRVSIKEDLIVYLFFPTHFFSLVSTCYLLQYEAFENNKSSSYSGWFSFSIGKLMGLILIAENLIIGSRSSLLTIGLSLYLCAMRGRRKQISFLRLIICGLVLSYVLGSIAFWRLYSNSQTFNWWVVNGYFVSSDLTDIGFIAPPFVMVAHTLKDMFFRAVVVADAIDIARLDLGYGGITFFMLYSILPGIQQDPGLFLNEEIFKTGNETGIPAPIVSQLFWDFGLIGVIIGAFFIGWIGACLVRSAARPHGSMSTILLGMYSAQLFLGLYGTFNGGYLVLNFVLAVPVTFWLRYGLKFRIDSIR